MEEWERSGRQIPMDDLVEIYKKEFTRSVSEQTEDTPNFDYWFGSGPYSGPVDIERRWKLGEEQLKGLVAWSLDHPDQFPWITPEGEPAIETKFEVELGGVNVLGFIDQITYTPEGLIVRDIKTGAKPGDAFQLATYAEAVRLMYGETPRFGDYFMGKTGKPTKPITITEEDRADVHVKFAWLEEQIQAGNFEPNPSANICRMCAVKTSCEYREG